MFFTTTSWKNASAVPSTWQTALDPTLLQFAAGVGLRYRTPFANMNICNASPVAGDLGVAGAKLFTPGKPTNW